MADSEPTSPGPGAPIASTVAGDFEDRYANNTLVESSVWDVRLRFGVLDQSAKPAAIRWHTAMNMPWAQAKLFAFYLQLHIAAHEAVNGKIRIPNNLKPPPADVFGSSMATDASGKAVVERAKQLRAEFD